MEEKRVVINGNGKHSVLTTRYRTMKTPHNQKSFMPSPYISWKNEPSIYLRGQTQTTRMRQTTAVPRSKLMNTFILCFRHASVSFHSDPLMATTARGHCTRYAMFETSVYPLGKEEMVGFKNSTMN